MADMAEHGTLAYARRNNCNCEPCRIFVRAYDKRLRFEKAHGVDRRVNPSRAREHCRALWLRGVTYEQMSKATGRKVLHTQIRRLVEGFRGREVSYILRPTAAALMALTYEDCLLHDGLVHSFGIRRRLEALTYVGYGTSDIAAEMGVTSDAVIRSVQRSSVKRSSVKKYADVYDRLCWTPGPSERARWRAYRRDYVPPMAWEDDDLDDPYAEPDRSVIACVVNGCGRVVTQYSLCARHILLCTEDDGFRDSERFRIVVLRLGHGRRINNNWGGQECA